MRFSAESGGIFGVGWSADGKRLATAGKDGTVRIWDVSQGPPRSPLIVRGHAGEVLCVAFHPGGSVIASGGADRHVRIWDAKTGCSWRHSFAPSASRVNAIAFSPDGKLLATGSLDGPIGIWDTATWKPEQILRGHTEPVFELAFNSDGTKLISAGQHATLKLWDLTAKPGLRLFQAKPAATGDQAARGPALRWVGGVAFRPDGGQLAAAGTNQTVALWELGSGRLDRVIQAPWGAGFALTYNHDGTRMAFAGSDRSVRMFDLKSDREPLIISDHRDGFASIALSHDGNTIATGGGDPPNDHPRAE